MPYHVPVLRKLKISIGRLSRNCDEVNLKQGNKIKWDKVNWNQYIPLLDQSLQQLEMNIATVSSLDSADLS